MGDDPYLDASGRLKTLIPRQASASHEDALEAAFTASAAGRLKIDPIRGRFDFDHLKETHRRIFEKVFSWAGKPRTVEMSKEASIFCRVDYLDSQAHRIFSDLGRDMEKWLVASSRERKEIPVKLAEHLNEINALHPFREGNGERKRRLSDRWPMSSGWKSAGTR